MTDTVPLATSVVDTVRRHPASLAQSALTIDHLSRGRFILGLGSGESENIVPYGFDFARPVGRFEEALQVIRLFWDSDGPVDFNGRFYQLKHARLDTEPYDGRFRRSGSAPAGPGCSISSDATPTAGGRPAHGLPTITPRCSAP